MSLILANRLKNVFKEFRDNFEAQQLISKFINNTCAEYSNPYIMQFDSGYVILFCCGRINILQNNHVEIQIYIKETNNQRFIAKLNDLGIYSINSKLFKDNSILHWILYEYPSDDKLVEVISDLVTIALQ